MQDVVRRRLDRIVRAALRRGRVVGLVGPRQAGKTTLARAMVPIASANYFDLESPTDVARLAEPLTALGGLRGLVVIDEVQRRPDLFPILRVLADRRPLPARFLVLGSASPGLLRQSSESLAGRLEVIETGGFLLEELGRQALDRHWRRGGFPRAYLARTELESWTWRDQFIRTFLERDVPQLDIGIAAPTLLRFWTMVAHYHGQTWSHAEPARSLGVSEPTVRRYLDALAGVFMIRQLRPWYENLAKRQVKSPKVYVRDSGLLHQLLGIRTQAELVRHPKLGASWEGYVVEQVLRTLHPDDAYFWGTHGGAELDLLLFRRGRRYGIEVKRADAPQLTASMHNAMTDLGLERLVVIYPGSRRYALGPRVTVVPVEELAAPSWASLFRAT
jgi:predicted AAA+ superfamily ATPase